MKLTDRELETILDEMNLPNEGRELVRYVRSHAPSRDPNTATAVTGRIASRKMGHASRTESRSGEVVACQEYEAESECREFWDQPVKLTVPYNVPGTDHTTVDHFVDFMVIRQHKNADGTRRWTIDFEEWRSPQRMQRYATGDPARWQPTGDGEWTQVPVARWLAERGLGYRIRLIGSIPPLRSRNRALLTDYYIAPHALSGEIVDRALSVVTRRPGITLSALLGQVEGLRVDDVFALIAQNTMKANLDDALLTDHDQVHLYEEGALTQVIRQAEQFVDRGQVVLEPGQKVRIGDQTFAIIALTGDHVFLNGDSGAPKYRRPDFERMIVDGDVTGLVDTRPDAIERLLRHSPQDQAVAQERLTIITPFLDANTAPASRTQQRWIADYRRAEVLYGQGNGVLGLLPATADRGFYTPRLTEEIEEVAADAIKKYLLSPDQLSGRKAFALYQVEAQQLGVPAMGKSSFFERVKVLRLSEIARARWGKRAAYSAALRSPVTAAFSAHGDHAQARVQADHALTDVHTVDSVTGELLGMPWITLMIDESIRYISASALLYDNPSARSNMVALREHVKNTGRLPTTIVTDNGKDFHSKHFQTFLAMRGVSIEYRKSGDARDGAVVEGGLKKIMTDLLWNLRGNNKALKTPRKMDRENDPTTRAVYTYAALEEAINGYIDIHNNTVIPSLGGSPRELYERSLAQAGERPGRAQPYSVGFRALTALSPKRGSQVKVDRNGVRINNLEYWCEAFALPGVQGSLVEVRYEPFNARVGYAKVQGVWHVVTASYRELEGCSDKELAAVSLQLRVRLGKSGTPNQLAEYLHLLKSREDGLALEQKERLQHREQFVLLQKEDAQHEEQEDQQTDQPEEQPENEVKEHMVETDVELKVYENPTEAEIRELYAEMTASDERAA